MMLSSTAGPDSKLTDDSVVFSISKLAFHLDKGIVNSETPGRGAVRTGWGGVFGSTGSLAAVTAPC